MSTSNLKPLPISIAPALLEIKEVMDGKEVIAVELTNGPETWHYDFEQAITPTLRQGKYPKKSIYEDYERRKVYQFEPARQGRPEMEDAALLCLAKKYSDALKFLEAESSNGNNKKYK